MKPDKQFLSSDLMAGLTFALVNIPQAMAHALLAAVNPVFGLYTLMVATPIGALFTSAMFMNVSTTSALAVAAGDTLITYPVSARGTALVTLVILIGVFQIVLGLLRLGWVTRFIPFSVMTGFMTGVAVMVVIGQLGDFTGYYSSYSGKISQLADLVLNRAVDEMVDHRDRFVDRPTDILAGVDALVQVFPRHCPPRRFRDGPSAELWFQHQH